MALNRGNLGFNTQIGAASTVAVYTVGAAQTAYIKSVLIHNLDTSNTQNVFLYVVENNGGSVGTASSVNQVAKLGIQANDTFFFEPAYPITLEGTNDTLQVCNEGLVAESINVMVLGDKEV